VATAGRGLHTGEPWGGARMPGVGMGAAAWGQWGHKGAVGCVMGAGRLVGLASDSWKRTAGTGEIPAGSPARDTQRDEQAT